MLMLQSEIISFSLTFALTGTHFREELNYVARFAWQKIRLNQSELKNP